MRHLLAYSFTHHFLPPSSTALQPRVSTMQFKHASPTTGHAGWLWAAEVLQHAIRGNATALSTPLAKHARDPAIAEKGIVTLCLDWDLNKPRPRWLDVQGADDERSCFVHERVVGIVLLASYLHRLARVRQRISPALRSHHRHPFHPRH